MKKSTLITLVILNLFVANLYAADKKETPPTPVSPTLPNQEQKVSRIELHKKQLADYQSQYSKILALKYEAELRIAETSGKLQEAMDNEKIEKK